MGQIGKERIRKGEKGKGRHVSKRNQRRGEERGKTEEKRREKG